MINSRIHRWIFLAGFMLLAPDIEADSLMKTYVISAYDYPVVFNLDLAVSRLKEITLLPGGHFSLNNALGHRKHDFKKARTYFLDGTVILEEGGGLCMVSSILYHGALEAGLEIMERHPHTKPVSYTPEGYDAALSYGHKDLKIKNNLPNPVRIILEREGRYLKARFYFTREEDSWIKIIRHVRDNPASHTRSVEMRRQYFAGDSLRKEEFISYENFKIPGEENER